MMCKSVHQWQYFCPKVTLCDPISKVAVPDVWLLTVKRRYRAARAGKKCDTKIRQIQRSKKDKRYIIQQWRNSKNPSLPQINFWLPEFPDGGLHWVTFWHLIRIAVTCWGIFDPTWLVCTADQLHLANIWNGKLEIHSLQIWRFLSWNPSKYIKHTYNGTCQNFICSVISC